jgi:hypothetical protein
VDSWSVKRPKDEEVGKQETLLGLRDPVSKKEIE